MLDLKTKMHTRSGPQNREFFPCKISFSVVRNAYWIICPPNLPARRIGGARNEPTKYGARWKVRASAHAQTLNLRLASYLPFVHHSNASNALSKLFWLRIRIEKQLSVYISNYTKTNMWNCTKTITFTNCNRGCMQKSGLSGAAGNPT
jgi:hypothetical protein